MHTHTREAREARGARHAWGEDRNTGCAAGPRPHRAGGLVPIDPRKEKRRGRSSGESRMREPRSNCERDAGERAKERSDWKSHTRKSTHTRMHTHEAPQDP